MSLLLEAFKLRLREVKPVFAAERPSERFRLVTGCLNGIENFPPMKLLLRETALTLYF